MVGGNRTVKDDEWRIQRKYSRVKYVDGVEFDFENYEGEGGGNKIIHVLGKEVGGEWKEEEFAIQVFDIEKKTIEFRNWIFGVIRIARREGRRFSTGNAGCSL